MDVNEFINWAGVSRYMTGNPELIRRNRIGKKHEPFINKLKNLMELWGKSVEKNKASKKTKST